MTIGAIRLAGLRRLPVAYLDAGIAAPTAVLGLGPVAVGLRRLRAKRVP